MISRNYKMKQKQFKKELKKNRITKKQKRKIKLTNPITRLKEVVKKVL